MSFRYTYPPSSSTTSTPSSSYSSDEDYSTEETSSTGRSWKVEFLTGTVGRVNALFSTVIGSAFTAIQGVKLVVKGVVTVLTFGQLKEFATIKLGFDDLKLEGMIFLTLVYKTILAVRDLFLAPGELRSSLRQAIISYNLVICDALSSERGTALRNGIIGFPRNYFKTLFKAQPLF